MAVRLVYQEIACQMDAMVHVHIHNHEMELKLGWGDI